MEMVYFDLETFKIFDFKTKIMNNGCIKIIYGSESGNAQDFAEQIWRNCRRKYESLESFCISFDDYQIEVSFLLFYKFS